MIRVAKTHNSKLVDARRKARELAAAQQERHEKLLGLAESYFVAADNADAIVQEATDASLKLLEEAQAKGHALVQAAKKQSMEKRNDALRLIAEMVETGASVSDVASRLGLKAAAVRAAVKASAPADETVTQDEAGNAHEHSSEQRDGHAA